MHHTGANDVLLTVSGTIPPGVAEAAASGSRPTPDYVEMARAFGADLIDHTEAARQLGRLGQFLGRLVGANVVLAWVCFRNRRTYRVVFTDGEQVGMPLAALLQASRRRPRHVMIGHVLTPRKKAFLHRLFVLRRRVDCLVVYSSAQRRFAIDHLGYPPDRVVLTPFMVDTRFWDAGQAEQRPRDRPLLCAFGRELRDYPTLIEAVRGLDVDLVMSTASAWSRRTDETAKQWLPPNVEVRRFELPELRQLYADASFVVVPLVEADFQSGITTILEGMSMGRAIVCTRTTGQSDTVIDGENGIYVPPGDVEALRATICELVADARRATQMGASGRTWARGVADVRVYAERLATLVS